MRVAIKCLVTVIGVILLVTMGGALQAKPETAPVAEKFVAITVDDLPVIAQSNHSPAEQADIERGQRAIQAWAGKIKGLCCRAGQVSSRDLVCRGRSSAADGRQGFQEGLEGKYC